MPQVKIEEKVDEKLENIRHSMSHILAMAVQKLFPDTKVAIGPAIDNGFYYDFDFKEPISETSFNKITKEMKKYLSQNLKFVQEFMTTDEAIKLFKEMNETYKVELIEELKSKGEKEVSIYKTGDWFDLCRGPHVESTKELSKAAFKIDKLAGAYWRGDEKNKMLTRIYCLCFNGEEELNNYIKLREEALLRDHRNIGKDMNLFGFYPEGPGFPFWKPNGMILYNSVLDYWRKIHTEHGYQEIKTPIILNEELWHRSGHWDNYKENMYFTTIDEATYAVKPMNCPGGLLIFKDGIHSYKEFPLKLAELGLVHRHEKSGVLHGLFRVRQFTQDDAHVYCTVEQVKDEVIKVINLTQKIYSDFGFKDVHIELSTRPAKSIGSDEMWQTAEKALADSLDELNIYYKLNPGDGAFYGPKIDFHIKDAIGRTWQCGTIQCDFSMPERFDITYVGQDGQSHRPVMLHRAIFGSIERFIGILIEHYNGKFPLWLSPVQIEFIPISQVHNDFVEETAK
ncbi:MAG: threonine--tRNA ligase, partial [Spirochaetes bacterium]|nr:threonine--tRNA ligase [Spirochaetota bacterium]